MRTRVRAAPTRSIASIAMPIVVAVAIGSMACATGNPPPAAEDSGTPPVSNPDSGATPIYDSAEPFPTFDTATPDFGPSSDSNPLDSGPAARPVQLSLGHAHSCVRLVDGTVRCWGSNVAGELGDGTQKSRGVSAPVVGLTGVAELSSPSGGRRSCARTVDGGVKCWGSLPDVVLAERCNFGDPPDWLPCATSPIVYDVPAGVIELASGMSTCARRSDGSAFCFDGKSPSDFLDTTTGVAEIALGDHHGCLRFNDATLSCWGDNAFGQLGFEAPESCSTELGTNPCSSIPRAVSLSLPVADLALGDSHSCALMADGTVQCWGANFAGQLGYGAVDDCTTYEYPCGKKPGVVEGLVGVTRIAVGGYHACAITGDGTVKCWGDNTDGELGFSTTQRCGGAEDFPCSIKPQLVPGLTNVVDISAGRRHTCAILADDRVKCWGWNGYGQLGDGTTDNRNLPVRVTL